MTYQQTYYEKHREELLKRQREKYHTDEEYRKRQYGNHKKWVAENRERNLALKREWQRMNYEPKPKKMYICMNDKGEVVKVGTITDLHRFTGHTIAVIKKYLENGNLTRKGFTFDEE